MSLWRPITRGFRTLINRSGRDREIADEVEHYLIEAEARLRADGLSPAEARRAARLEAGSLTAVREEVRSYGWENAVDEVLADLRHSARRLRTRPAFALVTVATLGLGIGAATAIFGAVNPILFEPLPYPEAGRIVSIWEMGSDGSRSELAFGTYRELEERSRSFERVAAMKPWQPTLTGPAEPERLGGQRITAGYFRALGVAPELGRDFEPADDRLGGANLVVVSHSLWRRRLGADSAIIGRDLTLDDDRFTVVGVMPAGFENVLTPSAEIWALLQYDPSLPTTGREWGHHLRMVGRTRSGVALDQVRRDLAAIAAAPVAEFSRPRWASMAQGFTVSSLEEEVTREVRPALLAVLGAVFLLLGIASVNVTNLFLARAGERRGEFAMRAALGAGRTRLVRQSLIESLVLALLSGAAGLGIAQLGIKALVALSPPGLPRVDAIRIDGAVFGFGLALTTLLGLLVGLVPALSTARTDLVSGLERGSGRMAAGQGALRAALVVAEVALALVLLVGAGLLFRSLGRLFAVAPGFVPAKLLTMQVQTSGHRLQAPGATGRFFDQALAAVRQVPGVRSADFTSQLPLSGEVDKYGVQFESNTEVDPRLDRGVFRAAVTPGYLETLGIPLVRGRLLEPGDRATAPPVALISEGFARRKFPATDPIGQRMHVGSTDRPWYTVVGVVGDVKHTSLAIGQGDAVYLTPDQWYFEDSPRWLVVRTDGDPLPLAKPIKRAIWSVDKDQPIVRIATMDQLVTASAAERRFALIVFEAFALVALALAAIGIYGVMSGNVTERTRELGVRSALGASRASILGMVIRQGMSLTAVGAVIGLGGAVLGSRALESLLFGITRLDPMAYFGVTALLAGVAMVACGVPAWRAARVDPSTTLRTE